MPDAACPGVPDWLPKPARHGTSGGTGAGGAATNVAKTTEDWFVDRATETGLDFVHFNGMSGELYYPEIMAPGVALFDYDNDGDLDVFVVQGQMLGARKTLARGAFPPQGAAEDRLFRNDLVVSADGTRTLRFTDVTAQSGIDVPDLRDGRRGRRLRQRRLHRLYRTGFGGSVLLRNNGDGTFTDVTQTERHGRPGGWGVSAAFVDYDRDGWLDLYVGNYSALQPRGRHRLPQGDRTARLLPAEQLSGSAGRLYHNRGNGTFEDVTARR